MKRIILFAIFFMGTLTISHAQTLSYQIMNNSTTQTWNVVLNHNGTAGPANVLLISPTTTSTGSITSTFDFPIFWNALSNTGCKGAGTIASPVGFTIVDTSCPGIFIKYLVVEFIPFVSYGIKMALD